MPEIIFVNPYPENAYGINEGTIEPPLGIGYLASIAEESGISCAIIDANVTRMKLDEVFLAIIKEPPRIVGISVNIYTYQVSLKLADKIKKYSPEIKVILGGPTPSSTPQKVIGACNADAVVIGEAEETLREIIDNYKNSKPIFKDIAGVIYRDGREIVRNEERGLIKNIDTIPFPAYRLFPDLNSYKTRSKSRPVAPLLTSRGCPYQCIFCSKDVFKNANRKRSPENVIKEIDMLVKDFGVKQIDILDDNFSLDKAWMEDVLDLLISRNYDLCINLQSGVRTESLDQEVIDKMRKARIWKLPIGVESGDKDMLKKIKKQLDLDNVLEVTRLAKKNGIKVYGFFMMGLPGDTAQSMQKTIDFAIKMDPNIANFSMCIPFPGTQLYEMVRAQGRFLINVDDGIDTGFYANEVFFETQGTDKATVLKYYKKAFNDFYFRPKKMLELAFSISTLSELKWFSEMGFSVIKNLWKRRKR